MQMATMSLHHHETDKATTYSNAPSPKLTHPEGWSRFQISARGSISLAPRRPKISEAEEEEEAAEAAEEGRWCCWWASAPLLPPVAWRVGIR